MPLTTPTILLDGPAFRLGSWRVEPRLNRLSRGEAWVQLEPKAMDLLLCLAERSGEVVTKREIMDAVWQTEFVSESTLASRIAELRQALGDSPKRADYIETIPKRGYRLVAAVAAAAEGAEIAPFPAAPREQEETPYPGLAAFTESEAPYFFGRESEVAALWRKITARRLLAVVGPSGAGKSSLLRAGVMPSAPAGWRARALAPGDNPVAALGRALLPDLAGSPDEVARLVDLRDPDVVADVVSRWRGGGEALLVVDQLEELFTLCRSDIRRAFVALLRRLVDSVGVHAVLGVRDDFLLRCHEFRELAPVFHDLTPVGPLSGNDLRRALTEPAARLLYRFEDATLADDLADEVAGERAPLPLLAFTMARLWELRDRERRLISRAAYTTIGGVAGALARHADATVEEIGPDRVPVVRELFRNLVTAQGTRVARSEDDLLSVFPAPERAAASEVLEALVRARLVASFEPPEVADDAASRRQLEVVHESLLGSWPRLVRWRAQDADGAVLRSQLGQAAALWSERGRPPDLLWSGATVRELRVWRERYPGSLTPREADFVAATLARAGRYRRRRRLAGAATVLLALTVAAVTTGLWRQSALLARQVEARRLLDWARLELAGQPAMAVAYATASLERADHQDARDLLAEALLAAPVPRIVEPLRRTDNAATSVDFSPDGRWLALGHWYGTVQLWGARGKLVRDWTALDGMPVDRGQVTAWFTDRPGVLATAGFDGVYRFWSVPDGGPLGTVATPGYRPPVDLPLAVASGRVDIMRDPAAAADGWLPGRVGERLRVLLGDQPLPAAVDRARERLAYAVGPELHLAAVDAGAGPPRLVARADGAILKLAFRPDGGAVAALDSGASVSLWPVTGGASEPLWSWHGEPLPHCWALGFSRDGRFLGAGTYDCFTLVWDLEGPPGAEPLRLGWPGGQVGGMSSHPSAPWVATCNAYGVGVWPLVRDRFPYVLRGHAQGVEAVAFGPDGRWLVSASDDGTVRWWPLDPSAGPRSRVLHDWGHPIEGQWLRLAALPDGGSVAVSGGPDGVWLLPVDGGQPRRLDGLDQQVTALAVGGGGRLLAAGGVNYAAERIVVWDLEAGGTTVLEVGGDRLLRDLAFLDDRRLLASSRDEELLRVDLVTGELEKLAGGVLELELDADAGVMISRGKGTTVSLRDLATGEVRELGLLPGGYHGLALDAAVGIAVASGPRGSVQVGSTAGGPSHLLLGLAGLPSCVALSPDARWIASGEWESAEIRLWPVPDLDRAPLHLLPRRELLERLHRLTNLRIMSDEDDPGVYRLRVGPFPGWEAFPEW